MTPKTLVVTMGDPKGIGPEVICKALNTIRPDKAVRFLIVGVSSVFKTQKIYDKISRRGDISFIELNPAVSNSAMTPKQGGLWSFLALKTAVQMIKQGQAHTLVTAPISKTHMQMAGFKYAGHTEYLCHEFKVKKFAMMLFHDRLRVVLTTIHMPLKDIFLHINKKAITDKLELTAEALFKNFKIKRPRIAVCGLNPHAGENGILGNEETAIIAPAIKTVLQKLKRRGIDIVGPLSSDVIFHNALSGEFDAVLCHYHDQGLIPLKTTGFKSSVNLTLGLPFVRTSPGHGTAFDIAGQGVADSTSMQRAIEAAVAL